MKNSRHLTMLFLLLIYASGCQPQGVKQNQSTSTISGIEELQQASKGDRPLRNPFKHLNTNEILSFREVAQSILPAVVHVITTYRNENIYLHPQFPEQLRDFFGEDFFRRFEMPSPEMTYRGASGVILTSDGYIVTNNHVIENADSITVTLFDRRSYWANVVGTDPSTDLALLKIEEKELPFISLGNSDEVQIGDWVLAAGNPFNLSSTITAGIISAKARNINILRDHMAIESFLQTDAAVNPGNSGGALVDLNGELVGINSAIATTTGSYAGYSFAIPINIAKKVIDDLLKFGIVQRAYLGIIIRDMNNQLAKQLEVDKTNGVLVDSVSMGSAADQAGIKPKDIIVALDGEIIDTSPRLQEIIGGHRPGDRIDITLLRKGKEIKLQATLKNLEGTTTTKMKPEDILSDLGMDLVPLTATEMNQLGLAGGLKVHSLKAGKIKSQTTIREGFIITKVDNKSVASVKDFIALVSRKKGGIMLEGVYPNRPDNIHYYAFGM